MQIELTPEQVTSLSRLPRPARALAILTEPTWLGLPSFSKEVASCAYLAWRALAVGKARKGSILRNGKPYEITERWAHRVRGAATRSGSMYEWGVELMKGVGCKLSDMPLEDRLWWREASEGADWPALRGTAVLEEIITAATLLSEVMTRRNGLSLTGEAGDDETFEEVA